MATAPQFLHMAAPATSCCSLGAIAVRDLQDTSSSDPDL